MGTVREEQGKVFIEGVRKVSWDTGEMCEFASTLVSALESLGEHIPYHYILGTSGVSFRFTLNPGAWDFTNYRILNINPDRYEPVRRAFAAVGYACSHYEAGAFADDAARIMESIHRGIPVIAFQVCGPSDCSIITGYDEGGDILLGWSTFQDIPEDHNIPHDETGYFRKPGWHENCPGYIVIGSKVERPPLRAVYLDALQWAVHLMRSPLMANRATGLEGLRVWADEMVADEMVMEKYFPLGDAEVMGNRYVSAAINLTMLRDHCMAEPFLRQAAEEVPDFQVELQSAAGCYSEVKRLVAEMEALMSDDFSERALKAIYDPGIRRSYANTILHIRDVEEEALQSIERLLTRL